MAGPLEHVDSLEGDMRRALALASTRHPLAHVDLQADQGERPLAGSRPACIVRAPDGARFFFKSAPPELVAAEVFAYRVRTLGKRPVVGTAARRFSVPGVGEVDGMLQPLIEHAGARLPTRPIEWTAEQREVMLREHPWEWLLANLDTHIDQYVLFGAAALPLNIDWDHALVDVEVEVLDRFTKRSPAVAPIRNALYDAFVAGELDLDLSGVRREVRRIARLDEGPLSLAFDDWVRAGGPAAGSDPARVRELFFRRKRRIGRVFGRFLRSLVRERRQRRAGVLPLPERVRVATKDAWQRFVIDTLHDRAVVPWLRVVRGVLAVRDRLRPTAPR